ncbi:DNA helicase [Streptomyces phage Satis]|nr:DNA helicase [Streptomyces phage Satis]QBZ71981.1 DNA helicase [Streptomyces phage Kradal]QPL14400.1 DNA helicase [Streptomyces phage EhyElimayoE]
MKFTDEQQAAIDLALKGESFSLVAPAGSGKSATALGMAGNLRQRLLSTDSKGLYLVYNTQARKDAEEKFRRAGISWFDVRTTSQIAWRAYASTHKDRMALDAPHVPAKDVAKALNLTPKDFGDNLVLDGFTQARLAADTIDRFCNSAHQRITEKDVYIPVVGPDQNAIEAARTYIAKLAWTLWLQGIKQNSNLRFTMNHAFKLVAESGQNFGYSVVLIDEAQDSNDATMKFLANQKGAQGILIGDPAQALYAWRGATDQILRHEGPKLYLTQSFRFGDQVAEEAMKHLPHTETGVTIKGLDSIKDMVTEDDMEDPDVVLTRTNAGAMTYAISYLMAGKRVALVKGTKPILDLAYAARDLMAGRKARSLELSAFENWGELVEYTKEPGGGHLKAIVKLIDVYGVGKLIDACNKMTRYNQPHDVAVTTCHSIKGLEWKNVQIGDDFFEPEPFENPLTNELEPGVIDRHEAMIHYVAVTRAQEHLDRGGLKWIDGYPAPISDVV